MQATKFSTFEHLLLGSDNHLGTSILLILAWIAASDGAIDKSETKQLSEISLASKHGHEIQPVIEIAKNRDVGALQLASEVVGQHFHGEKANLFLELAIGMAISDGYLLATENHILRYLSDLLGVDAVSLNGLFIEATGQHIPSPTDLSSVNYWRECENQRQRSKSESNSSNQEHQKAPRNEKAIQAYATLGLIYGASKDELKRAYRRLAQVHHPDRFSSLGEESVAAATSTFQRIKDAYEYLVTYA